MKIVILDSVTVNPDGALSWSPLTQLGETVIYDQTAATEILTRLGDAEIAICNKTPISRQVLENAPHLRCVCLFATGCDGVDVQRAKELGVTVCNVPGYSTHAVAQATLALLLEITNGVAFHHDRMTQGHYAASADWGSSQWPLQELFGKTIGLIGYGAIGRQFARLCTALDMRILMHKPTPLTENPLNVQEVSLETLLHCSDIVSLHCPLTPQTRHILNRKTIAQMKPGAILLNTARGPLVEEDALADALSSGHLSAAGLDVMETEPLPLHSPLLRLPNCFLTPHIAWAPLETRRRLVEEVARNIRRFLAGSPIHVVEP